MIPYASRTVDIILHPDCPLPKKGAKDVINLLKIRELSSVVEAVVQISPERYRLTFHHARQMQAFSNQDFSVHGKPVEFRSVSPFTWVYISRLSYGIPDEAITRALAPYSGGIKTIKSVMHENIYTGEHNVLMKITANIPARLRIAGHWCIVKYSGQKQVCFKCHKEGHVIAECPSFRAALNNVAPNSTNTNDTSAATNSTTSHNTVSSRSTAPLRPLMSYAAVAGNNLPHNNINTSESADRSSTPILNNTNTNNNQSAPDCASGAPEPASSASLAPSGGDGTVNMVPSPSQPSSPVRRRGKRRHSPIHSPQPEEKRATTDDVAIEDMTATPDPVDEECPWTHTPTEHLVGEHEDIASRPEAVPLPQDSEDDVDDDDNETDMDNDNDQCTDEDGANENGNGQNRTNENIDDVDDNRNDDVDDNDDTQASDKDPMDPAEYLDLIEDDYSSDDGASFATVSEAELPTSPAPHPMRFSLQKSTRSEQRVESAGAVAQDAAALYNLAAVLPTQGGSPSPSY